MKKNQPFWKRSIFACQGIFSAWQSEASFRFQSLAALAVFFILAGLRPEPIWWAVLLLPVGGVLGAELMNTALEKVIDRVHPEIHPDIKIAKDCAAGSVLVFSLISVAVFLAFLWERFA